MSKLIHMYMYIFMYVFLYSYIGENAIAVSGPQGNPSSSDVLSDSVRYVLILVYTNLCIYKYVYICMYIYIHI
jgi:hypothetical protein